MSSRTAAVLAALAGLAAALAAAGLAWLAPPAEAAYPGKNGRIAFASSRVTPSNPSGDSEIFTMRPDGSGVKQLTDNTTDDVNPAYSASGATVVYISFDGKDYELFAVSRFGGAPKRITNNDVDEYHPSPSPDGRRIAYTGSDGTDNEIFTVPATGGAPTRVTDNTANDLDPDWHPRGNRIAYVGLEGTDYEIYTVPSAGGAPAKLTENAAFDATPDWQPNAAPVVKRPSPKPGKAVRDRTPAVSVTVRDGQEDLKKGRIKLRLDGRRVGSFSYDRAKDRLRFAPKGNLPYGRHRVVVTARDETGLAGSRAWSFRVVRR
jgi:hypothetical protein